MAKLSLNDWQTIHARKELEEIHKSVVKKKVIDYTLLSEIVFVLIGFFLDNIFSGESVAVQTVDLQAATVQAPVMQTVSIVWLIVSIVALVLTVTYWVYHALKLRRQQKLRSYLKSTKEIIDIIDNKVCYYLMTAQAMFDMGTDINNDKDKFHLIETSYYLNKCVILLASVDKNLKSALSPGAEEKDYRSGKISEARIANILCLMISLYGDIEKKTKDGCDDETIRRIHEENKYFYTRLGTVKARLEGTHVDTVVYKDFEN